MSEETVSVVEASAPEETSVDILSQQGLETVSEDELRGSAQEETPATSEPTAEDATAEETKENENEDKNLAQEVTEETSEEPVKPPKGFVPTAALHEVRGENKFLKQQIAELTAALKTPVQEASQEIHQEDEFQVLSDEEFQELADESPKDALMYMKQLQQHTEFQRQSEIQTQRTQQLYDAVSRDMEDAVPGLFNTASQASDDLREFAQGIGFTDELFYLTNPSTQIILPGQSEPILLGAQAAKILRVIATMKNAQPTKVDVEAIKESVRKDLEKSIIGKVKQGTDFKSLAAVPTSEESRPEFSDKVLSEAQFMKLSTKEQELYLAGH
jgi:hypothetical protein